MQILRINRQGLDYRRHIARAAEALREGELVAFPTETVYGLAANADRPDALERLQEAKGRPKGKPFTFLVAEATEVERQVGKPPPAARALMGAFWPGPLTLVLRGKGEETVGFRVPDETIALDLIRAAGVRLVAPSANRSGSAEPQTAEDVERELGGRIALILDGGRVRLGVPSTVVFVDDRSHRVLRAGAIGTERIQQVLQESK